MTLPPFLPLYLSTFLPLYLPTSGGLLILSDDPATRVDKQDWSRLTIEAWPASARHRTQRRSPHPGSDLPAEIEGEIEAEVCFAEFFRGPVAVEAFAGKNGADIPVELYFSFWFSLEYRKRKNG